MGDDLLLNGGESSGVAPLALAQTRKVGTARRLK